MSLINDVLRELETRRPEGNEGSSAGQRPMVTRGHRKPRRWPWWLVAAVVVGAALHMGVQNTTPEFTQPALQASLSRSFATASPEPAQEPAQESVQEYAQEPEDEASPKQSPVSSIEAATTNPDTLIDNAILDINKSPVQSELADPQPSTIVIERADHHSDASDDPYLAAQRSLARGRHALAESQLRELVDTQPDHARARYLLATLLLDRQHPTAAVALLEDGLNRAEPALAASLLGRLLVDQGDSLRARQVLLDHAPAISLDPDYHLLLAAIERQHGDHQAAHDRYLALTIANPDRSTAWIGLGTSLESLGQPQAARAAYQQALSGRDRQAAAFARDRLNALPDLTGDRQ